MQNPFAPYLIIEHTTNLITLQLPNWRKRLNFFLFKIYPFILIALFCVAIINASNIPMGMLYLFGFSVLLIIILLLSKKYVTKVTIANNGIEITQKSLANTKQLFFANAEIEKIFYTVRYGRGGGTFFKLTTKSNITIEFLAIPLLNMKQQNTAEAINCIEKITGLAITKA